MKSLRARVREWVFSETLFISLLVFSVTLGLIVHFIDRDNAKYEYNLTFSHIVEEGSTLWQLALNLGGGSLDPRRIVREIRQINNLSPQEWIQPGDKIHLPLYNISRRTP